MLFNFLVPYQKVKREGDYYDDEENEKNKKLMKILLDDETSIMSKNRGVNSEGSTNNINSIVKYDITNVLL